MKSVPIVEWQGAYDQSWRDLIVPEAFSHPAKASKALLDRIFDYLFTIGALKKGDTVVDPFGGIATTAIAGAPRGVQVICCELEPKFVALAIENIRLHRSDWETMRFPIPTIVQGDSRQLRAVLTAAVALVSSPPYARSLMPDMNDPAKYAASEQRHRERLAERRPDIKRPDGAAMIYGETAGNLGHMPQGEVEAVVSSPPYAEIHAGAGGLNTEPPQHEGQDHGRAPDTPSQSADQRYGDAPGQLAKLPKGDVAAVVASPPYADSWHDPRTDAEAIITRLKAEGKDAEAESVRRNNSGPANNFRSSDYGASMGQLGDLPDGSVDAVVASPPYVSGGHHPDQTGAWNTNGRGQGGTVERAGYGDASGQIGKMAEGSIDTIVASPPYEGNVKSDRLKSDDGKLRAREVRQGFTQGAGCFRASEDAYGDTPGQLGQMGGAGGVDAIVSSPPFTQGYSGGGGINVKGYGKDGADKVGSRTYQGTGAERTAGNLETLTLGAVDGVLGSPPWGPEAEGGVKGSKFAQPEDILKAGRGKGASDEARLAQAARDEEKTYGTSDDNLANMSTGDLQRMINRVNSQVAETVASRLTGWEEGTPDEHAHARPPGVIPSSPLAVGAGQTGETVTIEAHTATCLCAACIRARAEAFVDGLEPLDGVVSSPPYEGSIAAAADGIVWEKAQRETTNGGAHQAPGASASAAYPATHGNVGNTTGETFWSAALQIVKESYAILKPGGHAVWITKMFVRDGKLVDFPGDWRKLCEHVGFETTLEARAMLVQEESRPQLFGDPILSRRERKSFFRRLAEKKGSPRIDWETVLVMVKR